MVDFSWWGNARVTPWMRYRLDQLNADLRREFGVSLVANSGIRLDSEQEQIWYARMTLTPNGRRVYETRWWNGRLWYRISPEGTVAPPGQSNHQIQGQDAAVDIADTGNDAGITNRNSTRGRWIRANAWRYDLVAEGDGFSEGWHFKILGVFRTPPGAPASTPTPIQEVLEEDGMPAATRVQVAPNKFHYYNIDTEEIKHCGTIGQSSIVSAVFSSKDELHTLTVAQFWDLCDGLGIPRNAVNLDTGAVWNPQANNNQGAWEGGGVWSRNREAVARLDVLVGRTPGKA